MLLFSVLALLLFHFLKHDGHGPQIPFISFCWVAISNPAQAGVSQSLAQVRTSLGLVNGPDSPLTPELLNRALGVEGESRAARNLPF